MVGAFGNEPGSSPYPPAVTIVMGCLVILSAGVCGAYGVRSFLDTRAQLEVGPTGIRWAPWSNHVIPWSHITDVTTWSQNRQKHIVLHLADPSLFPGQGLAGKFTSANRRLTGGDIAINVTPTDRSYAEALEAIARFRSAAS